MGIRTQLSRAALAVLALCCGVAPPAMAAGTLTITGTMTGSVDGNPFSGASFTAVTTLFWNNDLVPSGQPLAVFPSPLTVTLTGDPSFAGTYTSLPGAEIFTVLKQPAYTGNGTYGFEIQDDVDSLATVGAYFSSQTFQPLTQTLLWSGLTDPFQTDPFDVPLVGGGMLNVASFDSQGDTASIAVPEPNTFAVFGFAAVAMGLACFGRRRAFPAGWWYREPQWRRTHTQRRTFTAQLAGQ